MALFKILKGNESNLPTTKTPGYMYITEDQGNIFVDLSTTERIQLNAKNAATSNKWAAPITLSLSGDASGSTTIDGSANANITVTVKDDSHNHVISNIDNLQTTLDSKASKDVATQSANGLMSSTDKTKLNNTNIAYGTCSTAAATAAKIVTISGNSDWTLTPGAVITVKFSYTNTVPNPTLNVNNTGAKSIYYNTGVLTTSSLSYAGYKNRYATYVYDGTNYVFQGWSYDANSTYSNATLGQGYYTTNSASGATAITASGTYTLATGGIVAVKFVYDVPASATLNINSKGAKSLYNRGAAIKANVIKAGDVASFIYDGTQYQLISIDKDENNTYTLSSFGITATAAELNILDGVTATTTELNYVDGVTSNIQTQLNNKQATITGGASSITSTNLTASRALISNSSGKVAVSDITSTELGYLDGVTSNIQTQLNNKRSNTAPTSGAWFNGTPLVDTNGIMEVGKAIDFHNATGLTNDYSTRIIIGGDGGNILTLPTATGVIALTSSSITGNAATATTLQVARKINGTSFNGSADITTANWGTARNMAIADSDATNTGTAVSVNGSAAVTLKLPATIKATLNGNASTATKLASAKTITLTGDVSGSVSFDGSDNVSITTTVADDSHAHVIANIDGLETQINSINTSLASKLSAVFHYGATAPSNTNLLWIDSTATTGGLKFYNGSAWTHVPVCWS